MLGLPMKIIRTGVADDQACLPGCFTRLRACDGHVEALNIFWRDSVVLDASIADARPSRHHVEL